MNNLKYNRRTTPRQPARRISARGCEPSSLRLSSKLFRLFSTTTDENLVFNDALGTTVGAKKDGKYSAAALTAFGEDLTVHSPTPTQNSNFFTGLSVIGLVFGWHGGSSISDIWMKNLEDNGWTT
ncbi:MAG: hypothetical protein E7049_02625 [Lentisphaerae bacterium]|nr:hypothetical protein [Lentisphaerota bacterium]